ncbi:hypothetical protein ANN_16608 [Periplaneta americana]|uniref:Uncharacterized protein n=1 Tax=Periplaneta americana TaxID=6978 RepID=A0ABQ8ST15_PERAM|nr:hypothetical protein ANN_16608 [Periplaneta americana]
MAGLCEGGNEPSGSLKAISHQDGLVLVGGSLVFDHDPIPEAQAPLHSAWTRRKSITGNYYLTDLIKTALVQL